jgi:O-glycosyl hydrolase
MTIPGAAHRVHEIAHQRIDGFGYSSKPFGQPDMFGVDAVVMTQAQRRAVIDVLTTSMGLTRDRSLYRNGVFTIEPTNDNADPLVLNEAALDTSNIDNHSDDLAYSISQGTNVRWTSPVVRESWMGNTTATHVSEYAEWLLAIVKRHADNGQPLTHLSPVNEPSYTRNTLSGTFIRDVIKELGPRLDALGLLIPFVIPDDVRASNGYSKAQTIMADAAAAQYVGAIATHLYDEPVTNLANLAALAGQHGLPLWMTEFSKGALSTASWTESDIGWATLMHELLTVYNVSAIDYLWGWFGEEDTAQLITLNHTGTVYDGFVINKVARYTGQWSRHVPPGSIRIGVTSSNANAKVSAFSTPEGKRVIVAVNATGGSISPTITLDSLLGATTLTAERSSSSENWVSLAAVATSGNTFVPTLPATSVTTFTT